MSQAVLLFVAGCSRRRAGGRSAASDDVDGVRCGDHGGLTSFKNVKSIESHLLYGAHSAERYPCADAVEREFDWPGRRATGMHKGAQDGTI